LAGDVILRVEGVVKKFGELRALDGVTLSIPRGKITLLIGPNGSGKSTLMNVISGVYKPDEGRVYYDPGDGERDITDLPPHERFRLGIVRSFQIPQLFQGLLVLENTAFARHGNPGEGMVSGLFKSRWREFEEETLRRSVIALTLTKIRHLWSKKPTELSGGQMKLLEIARSMLPDNAKLILMDEPTAGVNPTLAHEIFGFIRRLSKEKGITFLIVEHRLDIAVGYVDYAYAMALGKVISWGAPEEVLNDPKVIESYLGG